MKGREKERRRWEIWRVQHRFFHFVGEGKLTGEAEWFWVIVDLTLTQLKPVAHFFENFGDHFLTLFRKCALTILLSSFYPSTDVAPVQPFIKMCEK